MITEQRILQAERNIQRYIQDEWLFINRTDMDKNARFFMKNAETSLLTAQTLFEISNDTAKKQAIGQTPDFESYLWVVVSSYYAMFYAALALMAKHRMKAEGRIHQVVEDTLIARFLGNQKLSNLLEEYQDTKTNAFQIVGTEEAEYGERAKELVQNYEYTHQHRNEIQYEIGREAKHNLAQTNLKRATNFVAEIRIISR